MFARFGWKADVEHSVRTYYAKAMGLFDERVPWSAMLHVRSLPGQTGGLEDGAAGAFAIVLALARDELDYREQVAAEMQNLGLFIAECEDLAPYEPSDEDAESVREAAGRLSDDWPVQYQDFHAYPYDAA